MKKKVASVFLLNDDQCYLGRLSGIHVFLLKSVNIL